MLLQDLTLRLTDYQMVGLTIYDGLHVESRQLVEGVPESVLLVATMSRDPEVRSVLAFFPNDPRYPQGAFDGVCAALNSGCAVVDLRSCCRQGSPEELAAIAAEAAAQEEAASMPRGARRVDPSEAAKIAQQVHEARKAAQTPPQQQTAPAPSSAPRQQEPAPQAPPMTPAQRAATLISPPPPPPPAPLQPIPQGPVLPRGGSSTGRPPGERR